MVFTIMGLELDKKRQKPEVLGDDSWVCAPGGQAPAPGICVTESQAIRGPGHRLRPLYQ